MLVNTLNKQTNKQKTGKLGGKGKPQLQVFCKKKKKVYRKTKSSQEKAYTDYNITKY